MLGELKGQQIEDVPHADVIGRIGCQSMAAPSSCRSRMPTHGQYSYAHSAAGMKTQMMRANPSVCFEVEHVDDLTNWRSGIAWGPFEGLAAYAAAAGMRTLLDTFMSLANSTARPGHGFGADGVPPGPTAPTLPKRKQSSAPYAWPRRRGD
jgi:nitroimidazol reductase NimA-like FMN-containing flavoprotein (pyridoxamine 5'-phosphate oxidase superfamily)